MVKVALPAKLDLTCTHCRASFGVVLAQLSGRNALRCPFCTGEFSLYDGLTGQDRKRIYHAIRDDLERQVYERQVNEGKIGF
jgi:predicted Zn finger-like uncharacterized protein